MVQPATQTHQCKRIWITAENHPVCVLKLATVAEHIHYSSHTHPVALGPHGLL